MELRQLRYFITLAEELNFTRTAQRLHIVQPALSRQIKELEKELHILLFRRNKRSVELTESGRIFLPEAIKTLEQAEHAVTQARRAQAGIVGKIEIGYSSGSVLSGVLGAILRRYREAFPDVELRMRQVYPANQIELLMRGDVDIIFSMSNFIDVPADCTVFPLAEYPLHVVMPLEHRLAGRKTVPADALRQEAFIAHSDPGDGHGEHFLRKVLGFAPPIAYRTSSFLFMGVLIEAGFGLALMPTVMASAFSKGVTSSRVEGKEASFKIAAFARKNSLEAAVEHLVQISLEVIL
ncbi:LysR substrate-binding domain-containing protein [uncultured Desulfovibrio sp.]|uniref:LysR substrate-binding domain-containing protein n=1 Tax=uncultured Desulfovibrio sp. TaxID=167968 RepID=UPI00262907E3|nr:LysR substrate-binding domain-containing protein [uncultured Desulfovibrio sp.]